MPEGCHPIYQKTIVLPRTLQFAMVTPKSGTQQPLWHIRLDYKGLVLNTAYSGES